MVLPLRGLDSQDIGGFQAEQPMLGKERIRPALMTKPNTSFHTVFQCCQHVVRPDRWFCPCPTGTDISALLSRCRHSRRCGFHLSVHNASIFLRPFARQALPCVNTRMDALTSTRRLFVSKIGGYRLAGLIRVDLPASCVWPFEHSVPKHLTAPAVALTHNPSARQAFRASPVTSRLARRPGRNGFVILRTARSHPVALHPLSQGRSYFQLQVGVCIPEEDLHLSDQTHLQAHWFELRSNRVVHRKRGRARRAVAHLQPPSITIGSLASASALPYLPFLPVY